MADFHPTLCPASNAKLQRSFQVTCPLPSCPSIPPPPPSVYWMTHWFCSEKHFFLFLFSWLISSHSAHIQQRIDILLFHPLSSNCTKDHLLKSVHKQATATAAANACAQHAALKRPEVWTKRGCGSGSDPQQVSSSDMKLALGMRRAPGNVTESGMGPTLTFLFFFKYMVETTMEGDCVAPQRVTSFTPKMFIARTDWNSFGALQLCVSLWEESCLQLKLTRRSLEMLITLLFSTKGPRIV